MEIICFSAILCQFCIAYSIRIVRFVLKHFLFIILLSLDLAAGQGSGYLIERTFASGCFVRIEITNLLPILTITFKNVLRTFEAEILTTLCLSPKIIRSY